MKQVKLTIDGKEITAEESLTILDAARANGIEIPTLCHHPALSNWGGCRLCVVEVDKSPRLVASCVMPVRNGMEVVTHNPTITASRRLSLEFLFAERNHNCMFCPDSGDCELQKMAYDLQMDHLTVSQSFKAFPTDVTGEYMAFDHNRCILCGRCVRACSEIAGAHVLGFHNRGPKAMVGFDLLETRADSACLNCGACLQVCPTGAISSRYRTHTAVKGQPAKRRFVSSFCAGCALQCPVRAVTRDNQLIRMEGVLGQSNGRPDHGQLCYQGRFEVLKTHGQRLTSPMVKDDKGQWHSESWERSVEVIAQAFDSARDSGALFGLVSSKTPNEVLMLFRELMVNGWDTGRVDTLDGEHYRSLVAARGGASGGLPAEVSWKKVAEADVILLAGADPQASHPMLVSLLRQAHLAKKTVAVIGQVRDAQLYATHTAAVAEKDLAAAIAAFGQQLEGNAPKPTGRQTLKTEQRAALTQMARAFTAAKAPLVVVGERLTGGPGVAGLAELLAILKKSSAGEASLVILKPAVNSAAAWGLGMAAREAQSRFTGAGLVLLGDEQGDSLRELLKSRTAADFLAVITPYYDPAVASMARVMLPKPLWLEEEGTYTSPEGAATRLQARVLDPPAGVLPTWEILQRLLVRKGGATQARNWEAIRVETEKLIEALPH